MGVFLDYLAPNAISCVLRRGGQSLERCGRSQEGLEPLGAVALPTHSPSRSPRTPCSLRHGP